MNVLKFTGLILGQLVKQVFFLPQTLAQSVQRRRQRAVRNGLETERLDRIRNPSKYLGK